MFAVYADHADPTDPFAALVVGDRPEPDCSGERDGWQVVEVRAASINHHDLWTLRGVGIAAEQFPMILGCDAAGTDEHGTAVLVHSVIGDPGPGGTRRCADWSTPNTVASTWCSASNSVLSP